MNLTIKKERTTNFTNCKNYDYDIQNIAINQALNGVNTDVNHAKLPIKLKYGEIIKLTIWLKNKSTGIT